MVFCPSLEMCCNNFQTLGVGQNGRAVCTNRVIIREREALCARELDCNYRTDCQPCARTPCPCARARGAEVRICACAFILGEFIRTIKRAQSEECIQEKKLAGSF